MDPDLSSRLRRHAARFGPAAFEELLLAIAASDARHSATTDDEDDLFELVLEDVLPQDASEEMEGSIMLLLDDYFDLSD